MSIHPAKVVISFSVITFKDLSCVTMKYFFFLNKQFCLMKILRTVSIL